jgi:ribosomal protein S12 methylthiotransferase
VARGQKSLTVHLVSLGCAKNLVDSERLLGLLSDLGLAPTTEPVKADLIVVNTCAFIGPAAQESIETILELSQRRKPGAKLAVVGCLPARDRSALLADLPEADLLVSRAEYARLPELVGELFRQKNPLRKKPFEAWPRLLGTPPWRAFLKIAEGCDNHCAYCLIPRIRGALVCRSLPSLISEARELARRGVQELTLVAQDLTAWRDGERDLGELVAALAGIKSLKWLRLMYAYPNRLTEKLVKRLAQTPKVVPYLDLPIQHAAPQVLKRMGRPYVDCRKLVNRLRKWWPGVALRTTLMVGFPGETEEDFEKLRLLVTEARFEHLGVFQFEPEEPAPAARFPDQIPRAVGKKRRSILLSLQKKIALAHQRARLGEELTVLVEGPATESSLVMTGRAYFQAPEVDGLIYFDGPQPVSGQMVQARVLKAQAYDLAVGLIEPKAALGSRASQL